MSKISPHDAGRLEKAVFEGLHETIKGRIEKDWKETPLFNKIQLYVFLGSTKFLPAGLKSIFKRRYFSRLQALRHDYINYKKTGSLRSRVKIEGGYLGKVLENFKTDNEVTDHIDNSQLYSLPDLRELQRNWPVDIIIPVGQDLGSIRRCLESIKKYTPRESYRLLLCFPDITDIPDLDIQPPDSIIAHGIAPFNFAAVNNRALKACSRDVVLLNDDTEVTAGWLEKLSKSSRGWCLAGARTGFECSGNPDTWEDGPERLTFYPLNMFCLYIPKRALEIIGNLDEGYCYYGGEDVDYSIRALESGIPLVVSTVFVSHHASKSFGKEKERLMSFGFKQLRGWHDIEFPFNLRYKAPLVSIIIATYNRSGLLSQSVLSLLKGGYPNIEIIIVDDCSKDETFSVAKQIMDLDSRVTYIRNPDNRGTVESRQRGLDAARGRFVAFHDDDDVAQVNRITAPLKFLIDNPDIDACYCNFDLVRDGVRFPYENKAPFSKKNYLDEKILIGSAIMLYRKRSIYACPFQPSYNNAIDFDWVFRALRQGLKIAHCPANVLDYHSDTDAVRLSGGSPESLRQHQGIRERELFLDSLD